ncbi:putative glutathione S-transferase 1 [[Candida] jaroonii]|uniref:Glutathione S-transferase 1 n=1 Tax=[Candida] jaroonii TaxID=467808 RepID=A0ACA9Y3P9_9ASCO|nr:putative glutathione S-transferase 1 [[Candida] jaroonii]
MSLPIKAFIASTPNSYKLSIFLELLKLKYEVVPVDLSKNDQKQPWFLKVNPNGKVPTLHDETNDIKLGESGAILLYLADTYDKERKYSYAPGTKEYYKMIEAAFFQVGGIGPAVGQSIHFKLIAQEKNPMAIERFHIEIKRLLTVLEEYLKRNKEEYNSEYLAGSHLSIADIVHIGFIPYLKVCDVPLNDFPGVLKWAQHVLEHPEIRKGFTIPRKSTLWDDNLASLD